MKKRTSTHSRSVEKLPKAEAAAVLWDLGVESSSDFNELCLRLGRFRNVERPSSIPADPIRYYKDISSIDELLACRSQASNDFSIADATPPSFEELKRMVKDKGIVTKTGYKEAIKSGSFSHRFVPSNPISFYDECDDWKDLVNFLDWPDALREARKLGETNQINNINGWRWLCRAKLRPTNIPANPKVHYEEFTTWSYFLTGEE